MKNDSGVHPGDVSPYLAQQAREAHGLWVGLYAGRELTLNRYTVLDPHCTVAHLGKAGGTHAGQWWSDVDTVCRSAATAARELAHRAPTSSVVDGLARFSHGGREGDPIVALLRGGGIVEMRRDFLTSLVLMVGGSLGDFPPHYIPHVTLSRMPTGAVAAFASVERRRIEWTHVGVTCGAAHTRWALESPLPTVA